MKDQAIIEAFDSCSQGFPPDRVVVDPELNKCFVSKCAQLGIEGAPADWNRRLLNIRKQGGLSGRPKSKRTTFEDQDEYIFAAEIAARYAERKLQCSLDSILCNPELVALFDKTATQIAPGYSQLQYRWAALSLRKAKKLEPELVSRIAAPIDVLHFSVDQLETGMIPQQQGVYLFFDANELLYVGETENLRKRLSKHLDHSDNKGLAHWIWEHGIAGLNLELQILAEDTPTRVRRAFELELIRSRDPEFNIKR